ncbi:hypothetical protein BRADI_5g27140v3 [Brachypodium distachyon]|uniref:F-box domain-containing protein n=1 Tax=Brachypodium distachyon TaxID=15368 RepID=A0A0Q3ECF6_BRADI|nr:hypothetical protein BRADI_5g27140v3 [Brachypodium distachyon]
MDKQSSQERPIESKNDGFSMELRLLPHDVLCHILSRLSIKDVLRMSTLSRPWRQLGICHPDLVFTEETFFGSSNTINPSASMTAEFITRVDNVLRPLWATAGTTTTLDKFVIKFKLRRKHKYHIDRWITFATMSRAKLIALDFIMRESGPSFEHYKYIVPLCNLSGPSGSCVKSLDLGYMCLKLHPSFCGIMNLKNLTLSTVSIDRVDLQCLLLSCALLESLSIEWCSLSSLCVQQELCQLQYLRVHGCDLEMIELHAPNLTRFEFDDDLRQIMLTKSWKLSEATFVSNRRALPPYDYDLDLLFYELAPALPLLHELFVLLNVDQVLMFSNTQTSFINLRHLNVNLDIFFDPLDTSWVMGLVYLLELSPVLEGLELHIDGGSFCRRNQTMVSAAEGPLLRHLRRVYISGFSDVLGLPELALYILGNATVLERMIVDPVENMFWITKKRMFAKQHLETEEFRHIVTVL